jgi:hypothetical protein
VTTAALIALAVSLVFAASAPGLGRRLPPALATRTLVTGGVVVTASTVFVLAVVAFTWIGQLPEVAALGPWSSSALHHDSPIPAAVAVGSGLLLALLGALTIRGVVRVAEPSSRCIAAVATCPGSARSSWSRPTTSTPSPPPSPEAASWSPPACSTPSSPSNAESS